MYNSWGLSWADAWGISWTHGSTVFDRFGMPRIVLAPRTPTSTRFESFDFTSLLASGETINTASLAVTVVSGLDAAPSGILSGSPSISGAVVKQLFTGGVSGVTYGIVCTANTSLGQSLQLAAYMSVVADI
jgi:hypothetical protein